MIGELLSNQVIDACRIFEITYAIDRNLLADLLARGFVDKDRVIQTVRELGYTWTNGFEGRGAWFPKHYPAYVRALRDAIQTRIIADFEYAKGVLN